MHFSKSYYHSIFKKIFKLNSKLERVKVDQNQYDNTIGDKVNENSMIDDCFNCYQDIF